jgi:small subunit ribosomal protein S17
MTNKNETLKRSVRRNFVGTVVSAKMQKTVLVAVVRSVVHPKYKRAYKKTTKFKCHDENQICRMGNKVTFSECRPMSKDKRWVITKILTKA